MQDLIKLKLSLKKPPKNPKNKKHNKNNQKTRQERANILCHLTLCLQWFQVSQCLSVQAVYYRGQDVAKAH